MATTTCGKPGCEYCFEGGAALDEQAVEVIRLGDGHRVVYLKQWSWKPAGPEDSTTNTAILHRMIWHPAFLGGFFAAKSHIGPLQCSDGRIVDWHGPYFREDIRPEEFVPLGKGEAARALEEYLARPGYRKPLPRAVERLARIQQLVHLDGAKAFELRMPEGVRHHELGYLCSEPGYFFSDLVLVDSERHLVSELVLFIDY